MRDYIFLFAVTLSVFGADVPLSGITLASDLPQLEDQTSFKLTNGKPRSSNMLHHISKSTLLPSVKRSSILTPSISSSQIPPLEEQTRAISEFSSRPNAFISSLKEEPVVHRLVTNLSRYSGYEASVQNLLVNVLFKQLRACETIVMIDKYFLNSQLLKVILWIHRLKQIFLVKGSNDLETNVLWKSSKCQEIFILMNDPQFLLKFGDKNLAAWDYSARVIIIGLEQEWLDFFAQTKKAKKTEHIIGIVKGEVEEHLKIYINELYWGKRSTMKIADWRRGYSPSSHLSFFPDKVSDLHQVVLNVTTFEFPPAIMYRRSSTGVVMFRFGLDIAVVKTLAAVFNFSIVFKEPPPGELWGEKLPNGTWTGMIGLLGSGQADISIANLYITALLGRRQFQEFSSPYTSDISCIITRMDQPLPLWQSPSLPFKLSTWIFLFFGLAFSGPVLALLGKASAQLGYEDNSFQSLTYSSYLTFGVHFHHPMEKLPHRPGTKIFVAFLWLYAMILITAYSSNLIAFLTVVRDPPSMETFRELHKTRLKVLGLGPFFRNSMAQSGNKYLKALAERFESRSTIDEAKKEILSGKAVMINSRSALEFYSSQITTSTGRPLTRLMKECFSPYNVGLGYQSRSPLKPKFDRMISWMLESGLVRKWFQESLSIYRKFQREDAETGDRIEKTSQKEEGRSVIALGTDHLQGIFIVYLFGILISSCLFFLERLIL